jgi:hypothetical protein
MSSGICVKQIKPENDKPHLQCSMEYPAKLSFLNYAFKNRPASSDLNHGLPVLIFPVLLEQDKRIRKNFAQQQIVKV